MSLRSRMTPLLAGGVLLGAMVVPGVVDANARHSHGRGPLDHVFVIMLENHSFSSVIGNANAPYMNGLASKYAVASNYYGVTHPSLPNYIAAISGSNWFSNSDVPTQTFDHQNLVDQLESRHISWAAYMESMPSAGFTGTQYPANAALYVNKHNPFILFDDVRNDPSRAAKIKPYSQFTADMSHGRVPSFVWITPNQCNDMHGGVYVAVDGEPSTPCPYGNAKDDPADASLKQKADAFVEQAVKTIMASKAWRENSAIFIVTDENDFNAANPQIDDWDSAEGCCDSPILPDGYRFIGSSGAYDGNVLDCPGDATSCTYGGGLIPAIIVTTDGKRHYTSDVAYNHYSLLRTIEQNWGLAYLGNAGDSNQVRSMKEFLSH